MMGKALRKHKYSYLQNERLLRQITAPAACKAGERVLTAEERRSCQKARLTRTQKQGIIPV